MRRIRCLLLVLCCVLIGPAVAREVAVPPALQPWRDWVLHDVPWVRCAPMLGAAQNEQGRICAWPGLLRLDVNAEGARFSQTWTLQQPGLVPLPGDSKLRPRRVLLNGQQAPLLLIEQQPMLQLQAGEHRIEGEFSWQRRPEAVPVPEATGLLELHLDGREVSLPERRNGRLWLGRSETRTASDSLALRVYRLLEDGMPLTLNTEIMLEVAGRAREVDLGRALPEGFAPIALSSALPVVLGSDGVLRTQLRPGSWRISLQARGQTMMEELGPPAAGGVWPEEEIWSFRPAPMLRVVQPEGQRPVDPNQVGAPWGDALPSFALVAGDQLRLTEASRGLPGDRPHRLHLQRSLWLDFDGGGYTARDAVQGELAQGGRLDMAAPWSVLRAAQDGVDLLVTAGAEPDDSGVELRELSVDLDVTARHAGLDFNTASGWRQDFESLNISLYLPPGWRLIAAQAADSAPGAWLERWRLLDLFWLSVLSLLAYRLAGWGLGVATAALLLLAYQEPELPLLMLSLSLLLGLLLSVLKSGRIKTLALWAQRASLLALIVLTLPFLHQQLRLLLYPQLEHARVGSAADSGYDYDNVMVQATFPREALRRKAEMAPAPPPPPPPVPAAPPADAASLDRIELTGSRIQRSDDFAAKNVAMPQQALNQYPKDALVQAGAGLPDWNWNRHSIGWSGPVSRAQGVDLWLLPPWASALWRIAQTVLLLGVLYCLLRPSWRGWQGSLQRRSSALALLALLLTPLATPLQAADIPDAALLEELRNRLLQAPDCAPACAALSRAELRVDTRELHVALDWQAAEAVAVPLPSSSSRWQPGRVLIDGRAAEVRTQRGEQWLRIERGSHRIELRGSLLGIDSLDLRFAHRPASIEVRAEGWEAAGIDDARLLGDSLQLVRIAEAAEAASGLPSASEFPPYVRVVRSLSLDLDWSVLTRVQRVAPQQAGFTVQIPLNADEQLQDEDIEVSDGQARISFAAGQYEQSWRSRLPISETIRLQAAALDRLSERWEIQVGPYWSAEFSGPPELNAQAGDAVRRFQPLPEEELQVKVRRPEALRGATVAIDQVEADWTLGQRSQDIALQFDVRATRGGQHRISLPATAELISVELRGREQNLRLENGRLTLPLVPGDNPVSLQFRIEQSAAWHQTTQAVDLAAPSANLRTIVRPSEDRWVLAVSSEGIGPAVLYWPQLLAMLGLAWLLVRLRWTPLAWRHWVLLGLGFSTVSWWAALVVVAWLLALGLRERFPPEPGQRWRHALTQLSLLVLTVVAMLCLLAAIPYGLLGSPDMQIAGNGSSAEELIGFLDRSEGVLPAMSVFSLPMWLYKVAILAWALWLANALLGWLRWGAGCMAKGGWWPRWRQPGSVPASPPPSSSAPAEVAANDQAPRAD